MRRRLLASTLVIVVAILLLFGIPLGIVLDKALHADAHARLVNEATKAAAEIGKHSQAAGYPTPKDLNALVLPGDQLKLIRLTGSQVANRPDIPHSITATVTGPGLGTLVRVASASGPLDARVRRSLLALVGLGLAALGAATVLALIQSKRLANPLARLARSATRLGEGDFSLTTPRSGVSEIDEIASSLDRSAERVEGLLRAERSFSTHASHQLRTALTGLQLRIEELALHDDPEVRAEADEALLQSARLLSIIEELLALARTGRAGNVSRFDLGDLARQHVEDVEPILERSGRRAVVVAPEPVPVLATLGAVGQALDILLSNAVRHGAGRVTVKVSADERRARVDITDEGKGITDRDQETIFVESTDGSGHGIGLALAHTLVTTEGGTIALLQAVPPVFRVELPLG